MSNCAALRMCEALLRVRRSRDRALPPGESTIRRNERSLEDCGLGSPLAKILQLQAFQLRPTVPTKSRSRRSDQTHRVAKARQNRDARAAYASLPAVVHAGIADLIFFEECAGHLQGDP